MDCHIAICAPEVRRRGSSTASRCPATHAAPVPLRQSHKPHKHANVYTYQKAHIYISIVQVLMLFSDNFDYQHLKRDFVCGVLSEEELGNKVFLHTIQVRFASII